MHDFRIGVKIYKMNLEYLVEPKSKEVLKETKPKTYNAEGMSKGAIES